MTEDVLERLRHARPPKSSRGVKQGARHQARDVAVQALYQTSLTNDAVAVAVEQLILSHGDEVIDAEYARLLAHGGWYRRNEWDAWIARLAGHWTPEQISLVDRNVMRMALFEMITQPSVPDRVILNEAVELAKRYGGEQSGRFVNGIVDRVMAETRPNKSCPNESDPIINS